MKKALLFLAVALGFIIILTSGLPYTGGSPGGKSGSPGDNSSCTGCHGGSANSVTGWIESSIPQTGYVPGETYKITISGNHSGVQKFGFEITAENAEKSKTGTFVITNANQTKLTNNDAAVTHTSNGTTPSGTSKSWNFDWTAPAAGTGTVTFYAAFNAANGDGSTSGDVIYISNISAIENASTGIEDEKLKAGVSIYPVPFNNYINIEVSSGVTIGSVNLYSSTGALVKSAAAEDVTGGTMKINTGDVKSGIYVITVIGTNGGSTSKRIIKK